MSGQVRGQVRGAGALSPPAGLEVYYWERVVRALSQLKAWAEAVSSAQEREVKGYELALLQTLWGLTPTAWAEEFGEVPPRRNLLKWIRKRGRRRGDRYKSRSVRGSTYCRSSSP